MLVKKLVTEVVTELVMNPVEVAGIAELVDINNDDDSNLGTLEVEIIDDNKLDVVDLEELEIENPELETGIELEVKLVEFILYSVAEEPEVDIDPDEIELGKLYVTELDKLKLELNEELEITAKDELVVDAVTLETLDGVELNFVRELDFVDKADELFPELMLELEVMIDESDLRLDIRLDSVEIVSLDRFDKVGVKLVSVLEELVLNAELEVLKSLEKPVLDKLEREILDFGISKLGVLEIVELELNPVFDELEAVLNELSELSLELEVLNMRLKELGKLEVKLEELEDPKVILDELKSKDLLEALELVTTELDVTKDE